MKIKIIKTLLFSFLFAGFVFLGIAPSIATASNVPSYERNFRKEILDEKGLYNATERFGIDTKKSLKENISNLFSPDNDKSKIWVLIKQLIIGVTILFIARAWIDMLTRANDAEKQKKARMSLLYILAWWFLVFGAVEIVSLLFNLTGNGSPADQLTYTLTQKIFFLILSFLKAGAFFFAIIMTVLYGYQMISAMDKDEMATKARKGIMNVLLALIWIKVVDFIYFIAQKSTFASEFKTLLFNAAKILWWAMGAVMVGSLIYTGFRYISAQGDETKVKEAQKTITKIFYAVLIVFMFLLISRQIIDAFTK